VEALLLEHLLPETEAREILTQQEQVLLALQTHTLGAVAVVLARVEQQGLVELVEEEMDLHMWLEEQLLLVGRLEQ